MYDLREDVSRLADDLVKRARPFGRELAARARPYADSLSSRADDLVRRARHLPAPMQEERSFLGSPGARVAGAAALGALAGLAFGVVRKAAVQGTEAMAGDWLAVLKAEHQLVDKLFEALLATNERQKVRRTLLVSRIAHALSKHAYQEEMVVYPSLKEATGDGRAMHLYEDHARIKIFLHDLNEIAKDDPLWIERARAFHAFVADHVREEEDVIYPAFHGQLSPQQNRRLTISLHKEGVKLA